MSIEANAKKAILLRTTGRKGKPVPVLKQLKTEPRRRMGGGGV